MKLIASSDDRLQQRAMPVGRVRVAVRAKFEQMLAFMDRCNGVGLAGPQIGVMARLVVMRTPQVLLMADPVIIDASANFDVAGEGCLSFPGSVVHIRRHARVTVKYRDYHNVERVAKLDGLAAICAQHEIDHLDGILFFARAYQQGMDLKDELGAIAAQQRVASSNSSTGPCNEE